VVYSMLYTDILLKFNKWSSLLARPFYWGEGIENTIAIRLGYYPFGILKLIL